MIHNEFHLDVLLLLDCRRRCLRRIFLKIRIKFSNPTM
jgi:hypothetical protein